MKTMPKYLEHKREVYEKRVAMGICVKCGCMIDNPQYKTCASCRSKGREAMTAFRDRKKEMEERRKAILAEKARREAEGARITEHSCYPCQWGKFDGDRVFCLFAEGTCAKDGNLLK